VIAINLPAKACCVEPGCTVHVNLQLVLRGDFTIGFTPIQDNLKGWQLGVVDNALGAFVCRCPKHAHLVQVAPATAVPKVVSG
jgi:hypothetical protein